MTQTLDLDGTEYRVTLRWNERAERWLFDLETVEGDPILLGSAVLTDLTLADETQDPRLPAGTFFVLDTRDEGLDAGLDDIGDRVEITYLTAAEVLEALGGVAA